MVCPGGYYCPEASVEPVLCISGYYCPEGSSQPIECPGFNPTSDEGAETAQDCYEEPTPTEKPVTGFTESTDAPLTTSSVTRHRIGYMSAIGIVFIFFS